MKRPRRGIAANKKMPKPESDEYFAHIAGRTEGGFHYGITWEEMQEIENAEKKTGAAKLPVEPMKLEAEPVVRFFAGFGLLIEARRDPSGLSIYKLPGRTPLARLVSSGKGDLVEVLWWSHRDRWEGIDDFDTAVMPLRKALQYIIDDEPGCFGFLIF